tara:strand:- start:395 stop:640 length:246 start_codon:yes stop_codon:yes gene_type:complete
MKDEQKILNQFQESIGEISESILGFQKQIQDISKEAEKGLSEKETTIINDFKEKAATLKNADFSSLMKLKTIYEQKLKDGI